MIKNRFLLFIFFLFTSFGCKTNYSPKDNFSNFIQKFNKYQKDNSISVDRMSDAYLMDQLRDTKNRLESLRDIDFDKLNFQDQIDYKFVESILVGKEIVNEFHKP